jgi:hypothetical protein
MRCQGASASLPPSCNTSAPLTINQDEFSSLLLRLFPPCCSNDFHLISPSFFFLFACQIAREQEKEKKNYNAGGGRRRWKAKRSMKRMLTTRTHSLLMRPRRCRERAEEEKVAIKFAVDLSMENL